MVECRQAPDRRDAPPGCETPAFVTIDIRVLDPAAIAADPRVDRWLAALALEGAGTLVENAHVDFRLLDVAGEIVAIAAAEPGPVRTYVCSPVTQYARYPAAEARRLEPGWLRPIARLAFTLVGYVLRFCEFDRVVYIDNWLLATNPVRSLGAARYRALADWLVARYPKHAIVHRSVNPTLDEPHAVALDAAGFRRVRARVVYVADPASGRARRNENLRRDRKLHDESRCRIESTRDARDAPVFARLYRTLYLDQYTALNPAYRTEAFACMIGSANFQTFALRNAERVIGFVNSFRRNGVCTGAIVGYDLESPREDGAYRVLIAQLFRDAARAGCVLNLSGGAGGFKTARSAQPVSEYDAVYDRHLPARRRLGWAIAAALGRLWRERRPASK